MAQLIQWTAPLICSIVSSIRVGAFERSASYQIELHSLWIIINLIAIELSELRVARGSPLTGTPTTVFRFLCKPLLPASQTISVTQRQADRSWGAIKQFKLRKDHHIATRSEEKCISRYVVGHRRVSSLHSINCALEND